MFSQKIWHASQKFLRLDTTYRNGSAFGLEFETMLEPLILQGFIVREPIERAMTHQKIVSVGTVFADDLCQLEKVGERRETKIRLARNARKRLDTPQNLLDSNLGSQRN